MVQETIPKGVLFFVGKTACVSAKGDINVPGKVALKLLRFSLTSKEENMQKQVKRKINKISLFEKNFFLYIIYARRLP
jgi:hypothetical protein